ncbi:MAG TPA: aconitase family protein, partial [Patescibacteria group bacterium]|nr:aconitase family protein [Patescibacteria group bacterium]
MAIGKTIIEKILSAHSGRDVTAGDVVWIGIDVRSARDFGGASVVKNLRRYYEPPYIDDPVRTYFTFDCNVPARDTGYAENQQTCRVFARETGIRVFDVRAGIGSHIMIERGIALPGGIVVGTDSHLNIMGAIGCFGQGMGDRDIAYVFASGRNWFEVPATMRVVLEGEFTYPVTAKDVTLAVIRHLGSAGALGKAIEFTGAGAEALSLSGKITVASMATEMGAIAAFLPVDETTLRFIHERSGDDSIKPVTADPDARYTDSLTIDLGAVEPMAACPPSPSNVKPIAGIAGTRIDTAFLGSCTNGRFEDMVHAASILR